MEQMRRPNESFKKEVGTRDKKDAGGRGRRIEARGSEKKIRKMRPKGDILTGVKRKLEGEKSPDKSKEQE